MTVNVKSRKKIIDKKLVDLEITQKRLAEMLGIDKSSLNMKLSGKKQFKEYEMYKICEILKLTLNQVFLFSKSSK